MSAILFYIMDMANSMCIKEALNSRENPRRFTGWSERLNPGNIQLYRQKREKKEYRVAKSL